MDKLKQLRSSGHPHVVRRYTPLSVTASATELRTGKLREDEYSIVDIIALRPDIVIRPLGSTVPEYVPGDIHSGALHTFANRPVVLDHPTADDGSAVSANTPEVLEANQFGHVFEPYYDDKLGLVLPSWLNDGLANSVGDEAESVLVDFRNGDSREISVGVYAYIEELEGVAPDGTEFGAIWLDYDADHLAILSKGDLGACSNAAGCGPIFSNSKGGVMNWKDLYLRSQAKIRRAMFNGEFSDVELRDKLDLALESAQLYGWATSNYIKGKQFTYRAFEEESGQWKLFQRGYKLDSSTGAVTLKDDIKEIIGTEPVFSNASASGGSTATTTSDVVTITEGEGSMTNAEVQRLAGLVVACERCPFNEGDETFLQSKDEEFLENILETYSGAGDTVDSSDIAVAVDSSDVAATTATTANTTIATEIETDLVQVPREEWEAVTSFANEARPIVARALAADKAEKDRLITAINSSKPAISKDVYSAWNIEQLRDYYKDVAPRVAVNTSQGVNEGFVANFALNGLETPTAGVQVGDIPSGLDNLRAKKTSQAA